MNWATYFEMMKDWKQLPAYKAEPRIDSFVGYYLPEIASDFLKDKIIGIIPEFPIRLGTVKPEHDGKDFADRSYKVDFYLLGETGTNYFVEFKTDSGSRRDKQDEYLQQSHDKGMAEIVKGITRIASVSSYKTKYAHLNGKLKELGLIDEQENFIGKSDAIKIVYVQPHSKQDDTQPVIDFKMISKWLTDKHGQGDFEAALAETLEEWADH